jgi:hypothetical protein
MPRANTFVEYCSRLSNRLKQEEWSAAEEAVVGFVNLCLVQIPIQYMFSWTFLYATNTLSVTACL